MSLGVAPAGSFPLRTILTDSGTLNQTRPKAQAAAMS